MKRLDITKENKSYEEENFSSTNVVNIDKTIKSPNSKLCDFEVIETNFYGAILVDKNTNVLYYWIQGDSMTPIYNSDGTVKLYDGE